jgi:hypothetical protein
MVYHTQAAAAAAAAAARIAESIEQVRMTQDIILDILC